MKKTIIILLCCVFLICHIQLAFASSGTDDVINSSILLFKFLKPYTDTIRLANGVAFLNMIYQQKIEFVPESSNLTINGSWVRNTSQTTVDMLQNTNVALPTWFSLTKKKGQFVVAVDKRASIDFVNECHSRGIEVWAMFSSFEKKLTRELMKNNKGRASVISQLLQIVDSLNLDGINLDFENMYPEDKELFTRFVREVTTALKEKDLVVSVDVTRPTNDPNNSYSGCYDRKALGEIVDYVFLMAYDQHWRTSPKNGPVASLPWVKESVVLTLKEVDPSKLILGIPFYTYDWLTNAKTGKRHSNGVARSFNQIRDMIAKGEFIDSTNTKVRIKEWYVSPKWHNSQGVSYMKFLGTDGYVHEIWFEDDQSLYLKKRVAELYGLAGICAWSAEFADDSTWKIFHPDLSQMILNSPTEHDIVQP